MESAGEPKGKKKSFPRNVFKRGRIKCGMIEYDKGDETDGGGGNNWPGTKATN